MYIYRTQLKDLYNTSPLASDKQWPPMPGKKFINLTVIRGQDVRDEYIGHTMQGSIKQVLKNREEITY